VEQKGHHTKGGQDALSVTRYQFPAGAVGALAWFTSHAAALARLEARKQARQEAQRPDNPLVPYKIKWVPFGVGVKPTTSFSYYVHINITD
jgi:hypothetical protein